MRLGDRYLLEDRLGAGGMGEVWRALDEFLGRTVAVKTMLPSASADPDFVRRFTQEATVMARVNHPAVASIHDVGRAGDGITYLVMEFVDGETLAQRLGRGRLAPDETMRLITQAAEGLQAVHDQGILHRDIKPANMLLRRDGRVVITDFGIARHEDASRITATGAILGTPSYLSPEQVLGQQADRRSDVYSLGLVAYECLAGERPFVGDNPYAVALQRIQQSPKTIGVNVPMPVLAIVERALAVDPSQRWQSAAALADAARTAFDPPAPQRSGVDVPPAGGDAPRSGGDVPRSGGDASQSGGDVSRARAQTPGGRTGKLVTAALAALVIAGGVAGVVLKTRDDGSGSAAADPGTAGATSAPAGPAASPAGFAGCGDAFCPTEPMCWNGLTQNGAELVTPSSADCGTEHFWETYLAVPLPDGKPLIGGDQTLLDRPEFAKVCTAAALADHRRGGKIATGWLRDAWPIPSGKTWLLHCLGQPPTHLSTGPAFTP
ncbi:hypothetical protein ADL15_38920 [Actinoplanes awajinensis subsp. mycoplanecinus]|uniref:non-specific serine/threonine protein kinase n=2 Tax=Actinoplanes awajinensis TaxID=135946 RepID=A0A124G8K0_9ACTN|nr:hypothetical protein ADL15_38920 [Actinoplanes awajinensis subsp. mycoplanecinus]